jgi:hypothetical protein
MKHIILLLTFFIIQINYSQKQEIINPKEKWFFGLEIGSNAITSYNLGEDNLSFQGGVLAEYYFAKNWSLSGRIKYFETGVSFYKPNTHTGGWLDLGSQEYYGKFNGNQIVFPLNIKWKFRIYQNFSGNFKLGYANTIETKSEYREYSRNLNSSDFPTKYGSFNSGYGFNYFLNNKIAFYIDFEIFIGSSKGYTSGLFGNSHYYNTNKLVNFGVKYNFKK